MAMVMGNLSKGWKSKMASITESSFYPDKYALICVDVQNDFLPGGALAVPHGDEVITPLLDAAVDARIVISTRDWHPADHCSFKEHGGIWPVHCVQDTKGAKLDPQIDAIADYVVNKGTDTEKESYSGWSDIVAGILDANDIKLIKIGGLATDYCVLATVRDALAAGYKVEVLKDACRGVNVNPTDSEMALTEMALLGAEII